MVKGQKSLNLKLVASFALRAGFGVLKVGLKVDLRLILKSSEIRLDWLLQKSICFRQNLWSLDIQYYGDSTVELIQH